MSSAYLILFLFLTALAAGPPVVGLAIEWHRGDKVACDALHCGSPNSTISQLCSSYYGVKLAFGARDQDHNFFSNVSCTYASLDQEAYSSRNLIDSLGNGAVISFIGDSIVRNLFHAFLAYLGPEYVSWYAKLTEQSKEWRGAYRDKMDHTYLCSPPLGPRNVTLAFFWRNYLGYSVSKVPWNLPTMPGKDSRCQWWENGDAMHHCDSASADGKTERWQCADLLDTVQLPGKPQRSFVLISSGGVHTVVEEVMHKNASNPEEYLAKSKARFDGAWMSMESTKPYWKHIGEQGGRNIFIAPSQLQFGLPRTTNANHQSVNAMNDMLEKHFKSRLRGRSNLTCEDGLEIMETDLVTLPANSPGTEGDGVHYPDLTNFALTQLITERLLRFNKSTKPRGDQENTC